VELAPEWWGAELARSLLARLKDELPGTEFRLARPVRATHGLMNWRVCRLWPGAGAPAEPILVAAQDWAVELLRPGAAARPVALQLMRSDGSAQALRVIRPGGVVTRSPSTPHRRAEQPLDGWPEPV
jgi:hypothetical protein